MNKVNLIGNITKDLELRKSKSGDIVYTKFTLAINEYSKKMQAEKTNFIEVVAFGKPAEILCTYVGKGNKLGVTGRLDAGSLTDENGNKKYFTNVILESFQFLDSRKKVSGESEIFNTSLEVPF